MTILLSVNNYVFDYIGYFLYFLPESIIMSLVRLFMYAYNVKVSSRWLRPLHT